MRNRTQWVATMALLAAMPATTFAGPFDFFRKSKDEATVNQETAEQIAGAMRAANLRGRDVEIEFRDGTAILTGMIEDATQKAKATQAASHVPGVETVDNRMRVLGQQAPTPVGRIIQTAAAEPRTAPSNVRTAAATDTPPADWAPRQRPETSVFADAPRTQVAPKPAIRPTSGTKPAGMTNQEIAQSIADTIASSDVRGQRIRIRVQNGTAEIGGEVASRGEWDTITRLAGTVPGVQRVNNKMTVSADAAAEQFDPRAAYAAQQAAWAHQAAMAQQSRYAGMQPIVPVNYQQQVAYQQQMAAQRGFVPPGQDAPAAMQAYGHPGAGMANQAYSMPNMPDHAWPSYASYPNSAQISYPQQYSASAWPYIGPFYPYPQVPLGWREAQLEWDDGYWHLNFRPRTSKWFWFVNPKNW